MTGHSLLRSIVGERCDRVDFVGSGGLDSAYQVSDFAAATIAMAALAIADLAELVQSRPPEVAIDRRLASFWFGWSLRPQGWTRPDAWDPLAGDYQTSDGWIRLHMNAPLHRVAAAKVLGDHADRSTLAASVARWDKQALEDAVIVAGGCAAVMRSSAEWTAHPQGLAVTGEPLLQISATDHVSDDWQPTASRPLSGIKVLDLTRVLAGPVATRFLAGFGARVLRIDPPDWDEPGVIPEVTLGKNCARLDLRQAADRARFDTLLADCDLIVHGYRPGALDRLGYGLDRRRALRPGLIDISLCAYGWSGPWSERRGFDSLVQMSCGIADRGMGWRQTDRPVPLPVQALDHGTGYLLAAAAIDAIRRRLTDRSGSAVRLSLARTAELLKQAPNEKKQIPLFPETEADWASAIEQSDWGPARRLLPPAMIEGAPMVWNNPARALGSAPLDWPN